MVDMLEEIRDLPVILQELDHWLIQTGEMVVTLVFTRVVIARQSNMNPPPFPLGSFGIPFYRRTHDLYFQHMFLDIVRELFQPGELTKDGA